MSSDWDDLVREAAREQRQADREREARELAERKAATDLADRKAAVETECVRLATTFQSKLLADDLRRGHQVSLRRRKKPIFGSLETSMTLVVVPMAALHWYQVGEGSWSPVYSYPRDLVIGKEIVPLIIAPFASEGNPIPYEVYEGARRSSERVHGLTYTINNTLSHNRPPEVIVKTLRRALAGWAARHWPELTL